jgi:HSP20 family protein
MTLMTAMESLRDLEEMIDRSARPFRWPSLNRTAGSLLNVEWNPRVDISEDPDGYRIHADVPGLGREDLQVSFEAGVLTIAGERREETRDDSTRLHRIERFHGRFSRSFSLPDDAVASGMSACCKDGQLTVTVPRKARSETPASISVPVE